VLACEFARDLYPRRKQTVEPLFGHTKHNCAVKYFHPRGRIKVRTE